VAVTLLLSRLSSKRLHPCSSQHTSSLRNSSKLRLGNNKLQHSSNMHNLSRQQRRPLLMVSLNSHAKRHLKLPHRPSQIIHSMTLTMTFLSR
jgi:hypothetical protein